MANLYDNLGITKEPCSDLVCADDLGDKNIADILKATCQTFEDQKPQDGVSAICADKPVIYDSTTETLVSLPTGWPTLIWAVDSYPLILSATGITVNTTINFTLDPALIRADATCATHAFVDVSTLNGTARVQTLTGTDDVSTERQNNTTLVPLSHDVILLPFPGETMQAYYKLKGFVKAL